MSRHGPVVAGVGHGHHVDNEGGGGRAAVVGGGCGGLGLESFLSEVADDKVESDPDDEVNDGAKGEKRNVQIGLAVAESFTGGEGFRARPGKKLVHAEKNGDEKEEEQRKEAGGGVGDTADEGSPFAAGEVVEHDEDETAEGDAEPEEVGEEVGSEELGACGGREGGERAGDARGYADEKCDKADA